ncbi:hypothetical protein BV20DRAFT_1010624 [Pilatotrama ljubarskyi]|nr:hypothetical protein BV20DRAFT_1010624 [Pilatotrama ljubarskyi]
MPLQIQGFSAHISCNGAELQILDAKQEDERTVSCWIASEVSQEFSVHWRAADLKTKMSVNIHVDGRLARSPCHWSTSPAQLEGSCLGVYETSQSLRPFRFSKLILTDDDAMLNDKGGNDDLGSIKISLTRVADFVLSEKPYTGSGFVATGAVHEKTKKAGVHTVSLSDRTVVTTPIRIYNAVAAEKEPFANFIFRYRPIELLRANGIAPPAPSQGPPSVQKRISDPQEDAGPSANPKRRRLEASVKPEPTSDDEDDDADDVTFLEEQLVLLQSRLAEKRAQKKAKTVVKRETSPIRIPSALTGEVIDLTDLS